MRNFKELRSKLYSNLSEKKEMNYVVKDMKSAEFIRKELSGLVKAEFKLSKKGSEYQVNVIPKTPQDEKIVSSFMDDARIEMLKDEFIRGIHKTKEIGEELNRLTADESTRCLLFDLMNVEFLSSAVLNRLIVLDKQLKNSGGQIAFCSLRPQIEEVFAITKLDKLFSLYELRSQAVAAMTANNHE